MEEKRNAYRLLVGKPEEKRPIGTPRRRWVDNIKTDLGEIRLVDVDWIGLTLGKDKSRVLVIAIMNVQVPYNARKISSILTTADLSSS
jgi:hypothetical protein